MRTMLVIALAAVAAVIFSQTVAADGTMGHGQMKMGQSMPMMPPCGDDSAQCQPMHQMADWQRGMRQRTDMMQMMMQ